MAAAKTGTGLSKNVAGALSYVLGPITGILFLVLEQDPFVKFHAMQSIVVFGTLIILGWVLPFTLILAVFTLFIPLVWLVLLVVLMYKAYQGQEWELPIAGKISRQLLGKI